MSGPYCETCYYFRPVPFDKESGECEDRSKKIYDRNGNIAVSEHIGVHKKFECSNWKPDEP